MIYRSSSLLSKNDNALFSVAEMAATPETYLECLLQLNEDCQNAENEYNIAYYRSLKESALNEASDMVLSEGLIGKAVEMISKIIEAIINFIKKIIAKLRGSKTKANIAQAKQAYEAKKSGRTEEPNTDNNTQQGNNNTNPGQNKTGGGAAAGAGESPYHKFLRTKKTYTYWHFADWNALDSSIVLQGCQMLIRFVEEICSGGSVAAPDPAHLSTALKGMSVKVMKAATIPEPAKKTPMEIANGSDFIKFCETNVVFKESRETTGEEFISAYEGACAMGNRGMYNEKLISDIEKKLEELKSILKRANTGLTPENVKAAQQYLNYFKDCTIAWSGFITRNELVHDHATRYFISVMGGSVVDESSTIHGELFNSDTLFANEDPRDFNRTEWLDLELTAEAFCFNQAVNEARRSMAVQEAIILAENNIPSDIFRKLQAMQEAEMGKLANAISEIIKRIKEFVTKFINDLQDKHGPNAAFMKRHAELIKKPFKIESVTSTGNIIDGLTRMQESRHTSFDPNTMNEEDKAAMFKAHFLAGFASKANGGKRPVKWEEGITISDYCKAFYGASMPADQYPPVKYTKQELEAGKANILKFMEAPHAFFSKIKQELSELEKEAKKAGAEAVKPGATNTTTQTADNNANANNQQTGNAQADNKAAGGNEGATQESMFYSVLYDRWFTEADIEMDKTQTAGGDNAKGGNAESGAAEKKNNSKVYIECLKDILLAKLTAARFIYSECNQLIRAHAKSYMSKEQAAAEDKAAGNNKQQTGNAQPNQQQQAQGEQQPNG